MEASSWFPYNFPLLWQLIFDGPSGEGPESQAIFPISHLTANTWHGELPSGWAGLLLGMDFHAVAWGGALPHEVGSPGLPHSRCRHPAHVGCVKPCMASAIFHATGLDLVTCLQTAGCTCRCDKT